jgi:antitoxin HicB
VEAVEGVGAVTDAERGSIGSPFEDFLEEEGIREEVQAQALKEVLAWQIEQAMKAQSLTKSAMARRMETSRAQLDRLLDPTNTSVTLHTLQKAAAVVGRRLRLELV